MTPPLSAPVRRLLAVGILLLAAAFLGFDVAAPLVALVTDREADIAGLTEQRDRLLAIAGRRAGLEAAIAALRTRAATDISLWSGSSATAVTSAMQAGIRQAVAASGGQVKSAAELPQGTEGGLHTAGVRLQIEGPVATLQAALQAVERARPQLFVDRIAVTAPPLQAGLPDRQPVLQIEVSVVGFVAAGAP